MSDRQCGQCQECCTVMPVEHFRKEAGVRCRHQCARGCAIYDSRPQECATYTCSWIEGNFREKDRPDKSGLCFETVTIENPERTWRQKVLICANQVEKGVARGFAGRYLKRDATVPLLIMTTTGDTYVICRDRWVAGRIEDWLEETSRSGCRLHYADGPAVQCRSCGRPVLEEKGDLCWRCS